MDTLTLIATGLHNMDTLTIIATGLHIMSCISIGWFLPSIILPNTIEQKICFWLSVYFAYLTFPMFVLTFNYLQH